MVEFGWVFLDVGNILLDEDRLTFFVFQKYVEAIQASRPDLSFGALLAEREARARAGSAWPVHEVAARFLDTDSMSSLWDGLNLEVRRRFSELSPPVPGARELLEALARRYSLGLIANQGQECAEWLECLGFLDHIQLMIFSERENVFKPDECLFRLALERAKAEPRQCLMVGDRLDNDIAPAHQVGMSTAWVRWPCRAAKGGLADEPDAACYLQSLERLASRLELTANGFRPTLTVDTVSDLLHELTSGRG